MLKGIVFGWYFKEYIIPIKLYIISIHNVINIFFFKYLNTRLKIHLLSIQN
jgi:hypothetical protein